MTDKIEIRIDDSGNLEIELSKDIDGTIHHWPFQICITPENSRIFIEGNTIVIQ